MPVNELAAVRQCGSPRFPRPRCGSAPRTPYPPTGLVPLGEIEHNGLGHAGDRVGVRVTGPCFSARPLRRFCDDPHPPLGIRRGHTAPHAAVPQPPHWLADDPGAQCIGTGLHQIAQPFDPAVVAHASSSVPVSPIGMAASTRGDRTRSDYTWVRSVANTGAHRARDCSRAGSRDCIEDCAGRTWGCNSAGATEEDIFFAWYRLV